jgi:hypothetical protein
MRQVKATVENSESLKQDLEPGRLEPPEDAGKGGDLGHGRAGADDGIQ